MTNFDLEPSLEPAASEPNSIAPMALDVNPWEIDLHNLHSGERLDLSSAGPATFREQDAQ